MCVPCLFSCKQEEREREGEDGVEVANRKPLWEGKILFLQLFLAVSAFPVSAKAYANICPASGKIAKQRNGSHIL